MPPGRRETDFLGFWTFIFPELQMGHFYYLSYMLKINNKHICHIKNGFWSKSRHIFPFIYILQVDIYYQIFRFLRFRESGKGDKRKHVTLR